MVAIAAITTSRSSTGPELMHRTLFRTTDKKP
jgi:hypothetical protein